MTFFAKLTRFLAKQLALGLFALLAMTSASFAYCIVGSPDGAELNFYELPDQNSTVRGTLPVGECGVRIVEHCKNNMCLTLKHPIAGWAEHRFFDREASDVSPHKSATRSTDSKPDPDNSTHYTYVVTGGDGQASVGVFIRKTPVDTGGEVKFESLQDKDFLMTIPVIAPNGVPMKFVDGAWYGRLSRWGGEDIPVNLTAFKVTTENVTLDLKSESSFFHFTMQIEMKLVRSSEPKGNKQKRSDSNNNQPAKPKSSDACARLQALANQAKTHGGEALVATINQAKEKAGFVVNGQNSEQVCENAFQDVLDQVGMSNSKNAGANANANGAAQKQQAQGNATNNASQSNAKANNTSASNGASASNNASPNISPAAVTCDVLLEQISKLMKQSDPDQFGRVREILLGYKIYDILGAKPEVCSAAFADIFLQKIAPKTQAQSPAATEKLQSYSVIFGNWDIYTPNEQMESAFVHFYEVSTDAPGGEGNSIINVPFGEPGRFNLYVTNKTRTTFEFDLEFDPRDTSNKQFGTLSVSLVSTSPDMLKGVLRLNGGRVIDVVLKRTTLPVFQEGAKTPGTSQDVTHDMPGVGVSGPLYALRNIPGEFLLRLRTRPQERSGWNGYVSAEDKDITVLHCDPEIDAMTFETADDEHRRYLLSQTWCMIEVDTNRGLLSGYVHGSYLEPLSQ